jgi:hypothetical protein
MKYSKEMLVNEKVKKKLSPLKLLSFIFIFTLIFIDFQRSRLVNSVNCINFVSFDEIIKTITITNRQNKKMSGLRFFFVHHICLKFTKKNRERGYWVLLTGVLKLLLSPRLEVVKTAEENQLNLVWGTWVTRDDVDFSFFIFLFINMYFSHPCSRRLQCGGNLWCFLCKPTLVIQGNQKFFIF